MTRLEIEQIRGVDCAASLKTLMDRRLVKVVGKKDVPGRPFLFGTSREFLEVFSLSSLSELPSMRDIEDFLAAKSGTPVPEPAAGPDFFASFPGPLAAGEELAESLHGEPLVAIVNELPKGISDDVLVEAASMGESLDAKIKPLSPAGRGFCKYALSAENFSSDPAEPLVTSSGDPAVGSGDEGPDEPQD